VAPGDTRVREAEVGFLPTSYDVSTLLQVVRPVGSVVEVQRRVELTVGALGGRRGVSALAVALVVAAGLLAVALLLTVTLVVTAGRLLTVTLVVAAALLLAITLVVAAALLAAAVTLVVEIGRASCRERV